MVFSSQLRDKMGLTEFGDLHIQKAIYMVYHLAANLSWVDLDLGCSTLPRQ